MVEPAAIENDHCERWWEIAAVLGVSVIPFLLGSIATLMHPVYFALDAQMIALSGSALGVILVSMFVMRRSNWKAADHDIDSFKAKHLAWGVLLYLVVIAIYFVCNGVWNILAQNSPVHNVFQVFPERESYPKIVGLLILVAYIANSIAEEIAMRGILQTHLCSLAKSKFLGIIYMNLLFAGYHIYQGWAALLPIFIFGLIMSYGRVFFKSIWPCVVAHTFYNLINTLPFIAFF